MKTLKLLAIVFTISSLTSCELFELDEDYIEEDKVEANCPGTQAIELKNRAEATDNPDSSLVYTYMAAIYAYKCECSAGSGRSSWLKSTINEMITVYEQAYQARFGAISKVSECKKGG